MNEDVKSLGSVHLMNDRCVHIQRSKHGMYRTCVVRRAGERVSGRSVVGSTTGPWCEDCVNQKEWLSRPWFLPQAPPWAQVLVLPGSGSGTWHRHVCAISFWRAYRTIPIVSRSVHSKQEFPTPVNVCGSISSFLLLTPDVAEPLPVLAPLHLHHHRKDQNWGSQAKEKETEDAGLLPLLQP